MPHPNSLATLRALHKKAPHTGATVAPRIARSAVPGRGVWQTATRVRVTAPRNASLSRLDKATVTIRAYDNVPRPNETTNKEMFAK